MTGFSRPSPDRPPALFELWRDWERVIFLASLNEKVVGKDEPSGEIPEQEETILFEGAGSKPRAILHKP